MTTTTNQHHPFGGREGGFRLLLVAVVSALGGIALGFLSSTMVFVDTTTALTSHGADMIRAPTAAAPDDVADALERAQRRLSDQESLIAAIRRDPRWEDPSQRAGMTYAMESTLAAIALEREYIAALENDVDGRR